MVAKTNIVAVAGFLAAFVGAGVAVPAVAKDNQAPGFDACYTLSLERGSGPERGGGTKEHAQHKAFMDQCMEGKIPMSAEAKPSALNVPANARASAAVPTRFNRQPASANQPARF
jgi:hypothetical protein